jgi:GntR family transcriptional regulator/MocR family aminotransferase
MVPVIAIDRAAPRPLHRQLYEGLRVSITDGTLRAGQRLPSSRGLASELGLSRITVLNAYAQLLAEGYLQSRIGSGTVVCPSLPDQAGVWNPQAGNGERSRSARRRLSQRARLLDPVSLTHAAFGRNPESARSGAFVLGQVALSDFPFQLWKGLLTRRARATCTESLDYGDNVGSRALREEIASYLRTARATRCQADQIMIVSGSQQALEIATRVLLDPGDGVWMEEPGYRFARNIFRVHGCRIVPVRVDREGLDVHHGIKRYRSARAALVTPSHQYPTGVTMSASRRFQLLEWAERSGTWIIEDDYDSEYRFDSMPVGCLQGLDPAARVIYVGTFSKVLFPSLRLGYLVIPPDLMERFIAVRLAMDIAPPAFQQAVLADFIREGHFSRHLRRMRLLYAERRSVLVESIRNEFGDGAEITGEQAGMHLSLTLRGISDRHLAELAAQQNLWLAPLSYSYIEKNRRQGFILGFGSTSAEEIPAAVRKLRTLVDSARRVSLVKPQLVAS